VGVADVLPGNGAQAVTALATRARVPRSLHPSTVPEGLPTGYPHALLSRASLSPLLGDILFIGIRALGLGKREIMVTTPTAKLILFMGIHTESWQTRDYGDALGCSGLARRSGVIYLVVLWGDCAGLEVEHRGSDGAQRHGGGRAAAGWVESWELRGQGLRARG